MESNGVYVGSPARRIGSFDDYVKKMSPKSGKYSYAFVERNQSITKDEIERAWMMFDKERK